MTVTASPNPKTSSQDICMSLENVSISYGGYEAVRNVYCDIPRGKVTAFIGPSGCGKSTVLRSLNRMNDLIDGCSLTGRVLFDGADLYHPTVDPVEVRRRIGMVFQQPNPFPKSIYENIAFGAGSMATPATWMSSERSLRQAAVWDDAKTSLKRAVAHSQEVSNNACALLARLRFNRK